MEEFVPTIIIDPSEPPVRRFKMIFNCSSVWGSGRVTDWARQHTPLNLACSEDGLQWDVPRNVNPVLRGIGDEMFCLLTTSIAGSINCIRDGYQTCPAIFHSTKASIW